MIILRSRAGRVALAALLLAGVGLPALGQGQQDSPESLLPPGFDNPPAPAPAPAPRPTLAPDSGTPAPAATPDSGDGGVTNTLVAADSGTSLADLARYELPDVAKHTLDRVGVSIPGSFGVRAFGRSDGRFLSVLMRRIDAPVASRWASIALRRALVSPVDTPRNVNGADFAAERAWLLIRMGEPVGARAVVQDVDVENYTPKLFQIAMQAALANADPGGLCPIADPGSRAQPHRMWELARAICAGLAGEPNKAGQLLDAAGAPPGDFDRLLAEKTLGIGAQGRRAVTIEWQGVQQLTAWRWGLAVATGEEVPEALYAGVGPQVRFWRALSPSIEPIQRIASAELAAAQGVFSNAGLVDLYSEVEENGESAASAEVAVARDLRTATSDGQQENRVKALRTIWAEASSPRTQYARLVLTARACAGITASPARAEDAERIVSSMLTTGYASQAMAWRSVVGRGSDGWAMLALADPAAGARVSPGDFDAYKSRASRRKAQLAFAGLAGLGRFDSAMAQGQAAALDVPIGAVNSWTRAIDTAARRGDAGSVALLAAAGMQTRSWERVTPEGLFHIVAAFRAVGMGNYARLIAVEAIARG